MDNKELKPTEIVDNTIVEKVTIQEEIANQDLSETSAKGLKTAVQLTIADKCGSVITISYECTSNNISCGN